MNIKPYKAGDESAILELFKLAFGKELSLEYWNWRFANNPFSEEIFIDLMWDGDLLVGHYAVSPVEMMINGKTEMTALSMTTMTHPEYGGKGIFSQLAKSLYNKLSDKGYKMVWGFPNNNSHYGFNKNLGWKDIAIQGMMSLEEKKLLRILNPEAKGKSINDIDKLDLNILAQLNHSEKHIKINKTKEYIHWRYYTNPTSDYKIIESEDGKGIMVYKIIQSFSDNTKFEVDVMDVAYNNDPSLLTHLLSAVYNSEENIIKFNLWDSLFSDNQITLEKIGFRIGSPVTYIGYTAFDMQNNVISDYRNWDMSFSYSDVF